MRNPARRARPHRRWEYVGNDVYNSDATNQELSEHRAVGGRVTFYISIQNDGPQTDSFTVLRTGGFVDGYKVRFFDGATDVTGRVVAGTYTTPALTTGQAHRLRVTVKVLPGATPGSSVTRLVTVTSVTNPDTHDAVRFTVFERN